MISMKYFDQQTKTKYYWITIILISVTMEFIKNLKKFPFENKYQRKTKIIKKIVFPAT